ncbi:MAG: discoidin domain-containing protein [Opitutus sp.]
MKRYLLALLVSLGALTGSLSAADEVPLKLELPRPLFVGTPRPLKLPNLEKARPGRRPDLMVPAGTVNLSKGKPVTASDSLPVIGELSLITDGDKAGDDGTYVEFGPGVQWVQIDLQAPAKIAAIVVWHFHSQARAYHDVIAQVSDDPEFKKDVKTVYNNDDDNSAGLGKGSDLAYIETYEGRLIEAKGATGRYVRLYSNGNTSDELNHYVEVEVFGQAAK